MQKETKLYKLKHKVCRKRKSKFPIKFKPKILKPDPKEELPKSDVKNLLM